MELLKKLKTAQIPKNDIPQQEIQFLDDSNLTKTLSGSGIIGCFKLYRVNDYSLLNPQNLIFGNIFSSSLFDSSVN